MELADAFKILAAARHFDDLDLALRYVGCIRSEVALSDMPPVPDPVGDDDDQPGLQQLDEGVSRYGPLDGWSLLTGADLEEAIGNTEIGGAAGLPERGPGRGGTRRSSPRTTHGYQYVIPALLEPIGESPELTPAYDSVPPRPQSGSTRPSAIHSAINPRTGAATMHSLLKRPAQSTEIDVEALVRRLALALPITDTPRLKRTMTVPPMHLLYDTSLLIGPYADDVQQLVRLAGALFGAEVLVIRAFRKSLRGGCGSGPIWTWQPFRLPLRPATVVFISGSFGGDLQTRVRELDEIVGELERRRHDARVLWFGDPPARRGSMRSWRMIRA